MHLLQVANSMRNRWRYHFRRRNVRVLYTAYKFSECEKTVLQKYWIRTSYRRSRHICWCVYNLYANQETYWWAENLLLKGSISYEETWLEIVEFELNILENFSRTSCRRNLTVSADGGGWTGRSGCRFALQLIVFRFKAKTFFAAVSEIGLRLKAWTRRLRHHWK